MIFLEVIATFVKTYRFQCFSMFSMFFHMFAFVLELSTVLHFSARSDLLNRAQLRRHTLTHVNENVINVEKGSENYEHIMWYNFFIFLFGFHDN